MKRVLVVVGVAMAGTMAGPGSARAEGEMVDGHPNWEERVYLSLTNRARCDPEVEMVACGANCPDAACYMPRPPLRHDPVVARAARYHSHEMEARGFFAHTSDCTLVDDIASIWPDTCDASASCACQGGTSSCVGSCTTAQGRVGLFGASYGGEIIVGTSNPWSGFYLFLHEPTTDPACMFTSENGHRWLLLQSNGYVGFGVEGSYGTGDFGSSGEGSDYPIASGSHYPRSGSSVDVWAHWYADAAPSLTTVDVEGTCEPMTLERGTDLNGTYAASLSGLESQGCSRYFFVFKDAAGQTVTYPETGSLGIGPEASCASWSEERPPQGDGCECTPMCGPAVCGDDGCGGSCGSCAADQSCDAGQCIDDPVEPTGTGGGGQDESGGGGQDETGGTGIGDDAGPGTTSPGGSGTGDGLPPGFGGGDSPTSGCRTGGRAAGWWCLLLLLTGARRRRRGGA